MNHGGGREGQWVVGQTFLECFLYNTPLNWLLGRGVGGGWVWEPGWNTRQSEPTLVVPPSKSSGCHTLHAVTLYLFPWWNQVFLLAIPWLNARVAMENTQISTYHVQQDLDKSDLRCDWIFFSLSYTFGHFDFRQEVHLLQKGSHRSCVNNPLWCFFLWEIYSSVIWLKRWIKVLLPEYEIMEIVQPFLASIRKLLSTVCFQDMHALSWTRDVMIVTQSHANLASFPPAVTPIVSTGYARQQNCEWHWSHLTGCHVFKICCTLWPRTNKHCAIACNKAFEHYVTLCCGAESEGKVNISWGEKMN